MLRMVSSVSPALAGTGKGQVTIVMAEDVTERIRLGEQLKQAERLKALGGFAASMAHEINNPMGIISACAEVMGGKLARLGEDFEEYVRTSKIIEDEAIRCSSIVKKWLGFARKAEMNPAEVDLAGLVDVCARSVADKAIASGVEVHVELPCDVPRIIADADQLRQVFLNLAINAVEAMPDGGVLTISAEATDDYAEISFSDTGRGVDPKKIPALFDPFYTTKPEGTGLGLAVSIGIVERHGGRIDVSNREHGGAQFTVALPVRVELWAGNARLP